MPYLTPRTTAASTSLDRTQLHPQARMEKCATNKTPLPADTGQDSSAARFSEPVSPPDIPSTPQDVVASRAKSIAPSECSVISILPCMLGKCKVKLKEGCEKVEKALKGKEKEGGPIVILRNRNSDIDFFGEFPERRRSWLGWSVLLQLFGGKGYRSIDGWGCAC